MNDNGVWSTLYYRAGDYHLGGKEALRLARTRHTSSDFARAERQQMILKALQQKAREFGFGDAAKLTDIATAILSKTYTDFTLADALPAYFRYQGFEVEGGNVLSSGNVLESKYTGDLKKADCQAATEPKEGEEDKKCDQDKGQYILVPRNDNWNTVRWYFHQLIEE